MPGKLAELIRTEIEKGLPGRDTQYRMAPSKRIMPGYVLNDHKDAGVLILLYPSGKYCQKKRKCPITIFPVTGYGELQL